MLRNKIISGALIAAMLIGTAACDKSSRTGSGDTSTTGGTGTTTTTSATTDTAPSDPGTTGDSVSADDSDTPGSLKPIPATDDVLFTYKYHNMAWVFQARSVLVTCRGDVYVFEENIGSLNMSNGDQIKLSYMKEYSKPIAHIEPSEMEALYNACLEIGPDVKTDRKNVMEDAGEYRFSYVDQDTYQEIPVVITGDWEMTTDDQVLLKAQKLAEILIQKIRYSSAAQKLYLNTEFINAPYGGTGLIGTHIVFDDYNEMIAFCRDNGIEIDLNEDTRTRWEEAKYMLLQVFDTNRQVDSVLITKDKEIRILPSLAEFEYDPAYDGKVCVSIWRFDDYKEGVYVDENGDPWELA